MDVTCERCGTEYEFDETLVSDRGTTVKCTNCGHLFKVFRPGAEAGEGRHWTIRKRTGKTQVLTSLRELQKLITKGELHEDDEISRSGEAWKPLGSIAELQTFFTAAKAAGGDAAATRKDSTLPFTAGATAGGGPFKKSPSAAPPPNRDQRAFAPTQEADLSQPPPGGVPPAPSRGSQSGPLPRPPSAPPPRTAKGTVMGVGGGSSPPTRTAKGTLMGVGQSSAPPPPVSGTAPTSPAIPPPGRVPGSDGPPAHVRKATPPPRGASTREEAVDTAGERPGSRAIAPTREGQVDRRPPSGRPPSARPASPSARPSSRPLYVDEEQEVVRPPRKSGVGFWIVLVLLLGAIGAGIALSWDRIAPLVGLAEPEDPVAAFLERGDEALAADDDDAYERAIREYTRGTAIAERDPRLLAGLARAHALLAQSLDFQADDLEARAAQDPALAGEAAALRREEHRHAEEAREQAEDAVRQDPNLMPAVVALADALRLTGDPSGARSHIERAQTIEREPSAELLRVQGLIAMDAADGNPSAARDKAAQAVEKDPDMIRARLLYARALLADGDVSEARAQIDAVLSDHPEHPGATSLKEAIEQGLPPAAPVVAALDAGVPDAGAAEQPEAEEGEPEEQASSEHGGHESSGGGGVPAGRDYSWYIRSGDEALERGDVGRARRMFEAALDRRAGGSEALNGLGYVMLETGNASSAAAQFRTAANQGYAPAYIGLGEALRRSGQNSAAADAYRSYLERLPNGPHASIARSHLARLGGDTGGGSEGGSGGGDTAPEGSGGGDTETGPAPDTPPGTLPAPRGATEDDLPPSDPPAVGSE